MWTEKSENPISFAILTGDGKIQMQQESLIFVTDYMGNDRSEKTPDQRNKWLVDNFGKKKKWLAVYISVTVTGSFSAHAKAAEAPTNAIISSFCCIFGFFF